MKPYHYYQQGHTTFYGHDGTIVVDATSGEIGFTCTSSTGDKIHPNPLVYGKNVYKYEQGRVDADVCRNQKYMIQGNRDCVSTAYPEHIPDASPNNVWQELEDVAMERLYTKLHGQNQMVVDLAEGGQTARMIKNTLLIRSNFKKMLLNMWRGKKMPDLSLKSTIDTVTNKWLEYRYGWQPAVYSIYDALDSIGRKHQKGVPIFVKGRAKKFIEAETQSGFGTFSNPRIMTNTLSSVRVEVGVYLKSDPTTTIYDWTSLNPAAIAWELVPFSFVADWVFNVGQVLSLFEDYWKYTSSFDSGWETRTYKQVTGQVRKGYSAGQYLTDEYGNYLDGNYGNKVYDTHCSLRSTYCNRIVLTDLPVPSGISCRVNLNASRLLDAAALLRTSMKIR